MIENIVQTVNGGYRATIDGQEWNIPDDAGNRFWQMVQDAIAAGATVTLEEPTDPANLLTTFTAAIDAHIEAAARAWSYNSAAHLASYVPSTVPQWAAEAPAFVAWRDAVWLAALDLLADVQAGEAEPPADPADFIADLPPLIRP